MARLNVGDEAPIIHLMDTNGEMFDLEKLQGKQVLISFYRFATCPFCNMRIHNLVKNYEKYSSRFEVVAIFESNMPTLINAMDNHQAPFRILSDANSVYYQKYGLEKSLWGVFKGMLLRMPTAIKGMMMGYLPTNIDSSLTRMPADFLIDEEGKIKIAYYGSDEGDHLDVDTLI